MNPKDPRKMTPTAQQVEAEIAELFRDIAEREYLQGVAHAGTVALAR